MRINPAVFAAMALLAPIAVQAQPAPADKLALIHTLLADTIATGQIPGGVVLIVRDGKIVHFEAQGMDAFGSAKPLRKDSLFGVASLSKPVTAVAILMLADDGKLKLDDPVSKYIPEFGGPRRVRMVRPGSPPPPFTPLPFVQPVTSEFGPVQYDIAPAAREMTVRDLLTHTSGIQIYGVPNDGIPDAKPGETLADVIPRMGKALLEFQPGSRWAYSNGPGFEVLGRIVEIVSGQPFDKFLAQRLFGPLDMKDTGFGVTPQAMGRAVGIFPGAPIQPRDKTTYFSGAAGLWSTAEDYSHFAQMLADGGEYGGRRILRPETVKAMSANQIGPLLMLGYPPMDLPVEGVKFGYGVLLVTNPAAAGTHVPAGSIGWDGVGTRRFWALPDSRTVIVSMVPLIGPPAAPFQRLLEATVMSALDGK